MTQTAFDLLIFMLGFTGSIAMGVGAVFAAYYAASAAEAYHERHCHMRWEAGHDRSL